MDASGADSRLPLTRRAVAIGVVFGVMAGGVILVGVVLTRTPASEHPPPLPLRDASPPIASEADVFRIRRPEAAVAPRTVRDSAAHARTLSMFRRLRSYPGAPPRVPHGLTADEFRSRTCNVCHRRGGFVARFGTYAPLTPHPERPACLQCHVPRDERVGIPLPSRPTPDTCAQCHRDPDARPATFVATDWRPAAWPTTGIRALPEGPHRIPHGLQERGDCRACHAGPGAVREIRTDHPERTSCRQCHVPVAAGAGWSEPHPLGEPGPWPPDTPAGEEERPAAERGRP